MASTTKSLEELKRDIPGYIDLRTNFEAYTGDEPYLFISYSHRDTDKVYPTLDKLNEKKYRIWYDESCETGNDFRDELRNKIEKCAGVILFVSEASMNSPFCGMEILCAKENNKRIYPVYLGENVEVPPRIPNLFSKSSPQYHNRRKENDGFPLERSSCGGHGSPYHERG